MNSRVLSNYEITKCFKYFGADARRLVPAVTSDGERFTRSNVELVAVTLGTPVVKFLDRVYGRENPILERYALSHLNVYVDRDF